MSKVCMIKQPAGIGDILFCQGIAKHFVDRGYKVIFPILNRLMYLKEYIDNPGVEFVDELTNFKFKDKWYTSSGNTSITDDFAFINTDNSTDQIDRSGPVYIMPSKYEHIGLDFKKW